MPRKRKRTWGTGSLFERAGRWWIRWHEDGRRRAKSFPTEKLARAVLAKVVSDVAAGRAGMPKDCSDAPTLEELFTPWVERRAKTHRAASDDRLRWENHLSPVFGKMRAGDVNAAKLRAFIEAKLASGLAAQTVGHFVRLLSTFFEDVKEQGHVAVNPVSTLPRSTRRLYKSTYDVRSTPYLERTEDIGRLYRALPSPHNVIFFLGEQTGCRVGELLGMQWRDIDFAAGKIHVRQQVQDGRLCQLKDKESRFVPLTTDLLPVLEAWKLKTGGGGQLFRPAVPDRGGRPDLGALPGYVRPHTVHKALAEALKKCGLPKLTLYQITRHTYASQWVKAGGSLEELARYMGHSSTSTTQHYAHLAPDFFSSKARDMVRVDLAPPKGDVVRLAPAGVVPVPFGTTTGTKHEDTAPLQLSLIG
jgi:integrase